MDTPIFKRKHRRFMFYLSLLGFAIAGFIWAYSELTDSSPPHVNIPLWTAFMVLCPPLLLSVPLIDVEPGSADFTVMWLVIGIANSVFYALIGLVVGRLLWKSERQ